MAILELDQAYETPVTEYQRGPFRLRYAYARSKDCQDSGERGQDYLVWRVEPARAAFALCDGVGQSFFGGLGSQIVGEALIEWLWKLPLDNAIKENETKKLAQQLRDLLDSKKSSATKIIQEKDLQSVESDIIRDALEARKQQRGTQSNFVCGFVDPPSQHRPKGLVMLFWLGDAKIQLWQAQTNKSSLLEASWNKQEGWSSKFGTFGEIHAFQGTAEVLDCIIAHSDGVDSLQKKISPDLSTEKLQTGLGTLGGDDVSFLELRMLSTSSDIEDDLVSVVRNTPNIPVKVIKQIETKVHTTIKTVEIGRVPAWAKIVFPLAMILTAVIAYFAGLRSLPESPPPIATTNTPSNIYVPPIPTLTATPTETAVETLVVATSEFEGAFLISADSQPIPVVVNVCMNLDPAVAAAHANFEVHGPYVLTGYSSMSCEGEKVILIRDGARHPVRGDILSVRVDLIPSSPSQ